MSPPPTNTELEDLARLLHQTFVANHWAHAEQLADGKYSTVYRPLDPKRIHSLLKNGESCLTYQLSSGALRWVCFDVDIKREVLAKENYQALKNDAQSEIVNVSSLLCAYLFKHNIPYLIEYSGNRGAHVWVVWSEFVDQSYGFSLQQKILDDCQPLRGCSYADIDRFPQTAHCEGKLGKGVKLPLSKHKKSGMYSCLLSGPQQLADLFRNPNSQLEPDLVHEQAAILKSFIVPTWPYIAGRLDLDAKTIEKVAKDHGYIRQAIKLLPGQVPTLDSLLNDLAKCAVLRPTIERCSANEQLSEKERAIMVGLLRRIQLPDRQDFGKEMLFELFSRLPNFKPNVTRAKLANLNLYPPTCSYLAQAFSLKKETCEAHSSCEVQKSPVELLDNCESEAENLFKLNVAHFEAIRNASLRYAETNDEIDLHFLRKEMARIDSAVAIEAMQTSLSQQRVLGHYYKFQRPETSSRERTLVSLEACDALLSAWFTKILDGLFGFEVSPHSYGYRFEPSLAGSNLFKPWFPQWVKYTEALSEIIDENAFDDYWVIKIDVRSFYDSIPLARLRVKLGSGPSAACGLTLQSLDPKSRKQYDTMCSTLVEWCRVITGAESGTDSGVPQGPAFARYLAELYFLQFDQDVEALMRTYQARYFRWVDDIFLIAPDKISAEAIALAIRGEIEALSLAVNEDKAFLGPICDYRKQFHEYKNDSKYFVNQVSRSSRSSSSSQSAQAREALNDMIEAPGGMGVRSENASFFLTHLKNSPKGAAELISDLLKVEHGRGSFFKHLFDHLVKEWRDFDYSEDKYVFGGLSGFRLEVFLNSLLWKVAEDPLTANAEANLSKALRSLRSTTQTAQSSLAKSLLVHLMLSHPKLSDAIEIDHQIATSDLIACLRQSSKLQITDKVLYRSLDSLSGLPLEEAIEFLHIIMLENQLSVAGYGRSADKFFALVLEELEQQEKTSQTLACLQQSRHGSGELLKKYHLLCCLCSVVGREKKQEELGRVWKALLVVTNELPIWSPSKPLWLEKADTVEIVQTTCTILLAAIAGGDGLNVGYSDRHNIYDEYHYHLLVFIFAKTNKAVVDSLPSKADMLAEATKHNILFLQWLLSSGDVDLHPDKKMCLRNIVENDLTILRRGSQLLVRHPNKLLFKSEPARPKCLLSQPESSKFPFINTVYALEESAVDIIALFERQSNLVGVMELAARIFQVLSAFRAAHFGDKGGVPNVFSKGFGILENCLIPAVPATALGSKLLISERDSILVISNDLESAWSLLIERIKSSKRDLLPYDHYAQVTAADFRTLVPPGLDHLSQVKFLEIFCAEFRKSPDSGPLEVDHSKLRAAAEFASWSIAQKNNAKEKRLPTLLGETFTIYLSITGDTGDFAKRMSFVPVQSPSDRSLWDLLDAFQKSLAWAAGDKFLGIGGINLLDLLTREFMYLVAVFTESADIETSSKSDNVKVLLRSVERAKVERGDDYELIIAGMKLMSASGDVVAPMDVLLCRFGGRSPVWDSLKAQHAAELGRGLVYSVIHKSKLLLFLADDVIRAMFEMVRRRSEAVSNCGQSAIDPAIGECLIDKDPNPKTLKIDPSFQDAVNVILSNHVTSEKIKSFVDGERFLLRWLGQFELSDAKVLLDVIAAHQCITMNDVDIFIKHVVSLKETSIFFSAKRPDDLGGVQRLFMLTQGGLEIMRSLELDQAVNKIAAYDGSNKKHLVILAEVVLSGGQLTRSFEAHYLSAKACKEEFIDANKYFPIADIGSEFISGMKRFKEIIVLTASHTTEGALKISECLMKHLNIGAEAIQVRGSTLIDAKCYLGRSDKISVAAKKVLMNLVCDKPRLKTLFKMDNEQYYDHNLKWLKEANLFVRPNSVPKKGLQLFVLQPRNRFIPPLFRKINEPE